MQRERWSKILQSDYDGVPDRAPGMPILQSHGNLVSRGDLITQDNISVPAGFTITINKDNFSQLCTIGDPGQLVQYNLKSTSGQSNIITGSMQTDQSGIYASNLGSGSGYHGPVAYMQLPYEIGKSNQYWHIIYKFTINNNSSSYIYDINLRVGFSFVVAYHDGQSGVLSGGRWISIINGTTSNVLSSANVNITTDTIKIYHYANNTTKLYINSSLQFNGQDPITLNKSDNMLTIQISQYSSYPFPYHRIQEITVSTDPSYDPQP